MRIEDMPAGRNMDALVAEKVMELRSFHAGDPERLCGPMGFAEPEQCGEFYYLDEHFTTHTGVWPAIMPIPEYSEDIAAAWLLVERLGLALIPQSREGGGFDWLAIDLDQVCYGEDIRLVERNEVFCSKPDAPHAISITALLACGITEVSDAN